MHGCFAALAGLWHREQTGDARHIDVSAQECIAAMLETSFVQYTYGGREVTRLGGRQAAPWTIFECAGGHVMMFCLEEDQWRRIVDLMGDPEWAHDALFADAAARGRNADALNALIGDWIKEWKVAEIFREAQKRRIPLAPVSLMNDLYNSEQLRARGFFVSLNQPGIGEIKVPGAPFKSSAGGWRPGSAAPRLGEHNGRILSLLAEQSQHRAIKAPPAGVISGSRLPMEGIRVLDFTWVWAGPYCTLQFAHMGAEVIRVESQNRLCATRRLEPFADNIAGVNRAGYFNQFSQGKRSITLNLGTPAGVEIARELARQCDIVADNFSAGTMERIGLGYETLRSYRPDIIMISISGCGQTGPWRNLLSYGPPSAALAGFCSVTGYEEKGPSETGISFPDPTAGILGSIAAVAALYHRHRTGEGQYIDLSQLEATLTLLPEALLEYHFNGVAPPRAGNHDPRMSPHNTFKTRGDENQWVSIAVGDDSEWRALCNAMEMPRLAADPRFRTAELRKRNETALDEIINGWTSERDRWDVTVLLQRADVAAFPSMSNKDLTADPHLLARNFFSRLSHPESGRLLHAGVPWKIYGIPSGVRRPAPLLGADTATVLKDLLGMPEKSISELQASGVLT
jgi:crotonobetainyl-CoA:carnitine CoA-transferase CaiB-like acyl-CoA transferase